MVANRSWFTPHPRFVVSADSFVVPASFCSRRPSPCRIPFLAAVSFPFFKWHRLSLVFLFFSEPPSCRARRPPPLLRAPLPSPPLPCTATSPTLIQYHLHLLNTWHPSLVFLFPVKTQPPPLVSLGCRQTLTLAASAAFPPPPIAAVVVVALPVSPPFPRRYGCHHNHPISSVYPSNLDRCRCSSVAGSPRRRLSPPVVVVSR